MVEREDGSIDRVSPGARLAAGIIAGLIAGILVLGFMMAFANATGAGLTMPLKALGAFVYGVESLVAGPQAMLVGALIQLGFSILLGILFALCMSRATSMIAALFAGIAVGIVIWVAMDLLVLPFENPTMEARIGLMPLAYFVAHLMYGIGLATTPLFIRVFSRDANHSHRPRATGTQPV
jgi:uncharacterized membrane protein YagU involved in acid resistance